MYKEDFQGNSQPYNPNEKIIIEVPSEESPAVFEPTDEGKTTFDAYPHVPFNKEVLSSEHDANKVLSKSFEHTPEEQRTIDALIGSLKDATLEK